MYSELGGIMNSTKITGYDYESIDPAATPVTLEELDALKATLLWDDTTDTLLRRAGELLEEQVEDILDLWYGYVGSHPHLVTYFDGTSGEPDSAYLSAVRARFGQWIRDLCNRDFDSRWLAYQHEVALRHHSAKKNVTDGINSPQAYVPLRYLIAFVYPITVTIRDFLARAAGPDDDVDALVDAWFKAVVLTTALWAEPFSDLW